MSESVVGRWAREKLEHLRKYLHAYTTIMRKQRFQGYYYIDAFAGPGEHRVRQGRTGSQSAKRTLLDIAEYGYEQQEQQAFLAGSPRVSLDLEHPFSGYVFVERSASRVAELRRLQEEYGISRKIVIRQAECATYLREKVAHNPAINWKRNRAVVFLDPFGMQVEWKTIELLARTEAIDVFLNFPVGMAIQRLLKRNPDEFSQAERRKLDDYFGSPDWFDVLYKPSKSLFGDDIEEKVRPSGIALLKWYRTRLGKLFAQGASKAALIRNTQGAHLYYLLLASHNNAEIKIANHILSAGEGV